MQIKANPKLLGDLSSFVASCVVGQNATDSLEIWAVGADFDDDTALAEAAVDESGIATFAISGSTAGKHLSDVLFVARDGEDAPVVLFESEGFSAHVLPGATLGFEVDLKKAIFPALHGAVVRWDADDEEYVVAPAAAAGDSYTKAEADDRFEPISSP